MNHAAAGPARPRGVVFDLDGTLLDTWRIHEHCLREAVRDLSGSQVGKVRLWRAQRPTDLATLGELVGAEHAQEALLAYRAALARELTVRLPPPVRGSKQRWRGCEAAGSRSASAPDGRVRTRRPC